jgi:uncharacterized protein (TIGR03083 family)
MRSPQPILVADRFPEILDALLELLSSLSEAEWALPTACAGWSVKDVALHLLGGDVGILSRKRDAAAIAGEPIRNWADLVAYLNHQNALWVQATRRTSPRLLCDLLRLTGTQVSTYFQSLDPDAIGDPVSWAGPERAPVWLDLAREFTERWHHQQHIREAVGKPGLMQPRYLAPVLDTFVRALPHTYRKLDAPEQTLVALTISGESGGRWFLLREHGRWALYLELERLPQAEVILDQDAAWRLFTRGIDRDTAQAQARVAGDRHLGSQILEMVSIIA